MDTMTEDEWLWKERSELSRAGEIWLEEEDKEETLRCRQTAEE